MELDANSKSRMSYHVSCHSIDVFGILQTIAFLREDVHFWSSSNSGDASKCGFCTKHGSQAMSKIFGPARGRNSWQRNWLLWCVRELSEKHHPSLDMGRFGDMRSGSRKSRDGSFRNQHVSCFTRIAQVFQWMTVESSFSPLCEPKLQFFSGNLPIVSNSVLELTYIKFGWVQQMGRICHNCNLAAWVFNCTRPSRPTEFIRCCPFYDCRATDSEGRDGLWIQGIDIR